MSQFNKLTKLAIAASVCIGLASCGGGGGDSGASSGGGSGGGTVSGAAAKGIIQNGIVTLFDGAGNPLSTTSSPIRTSANGSYIATLSNASYAGPVFVEISADGMTTILNEATGSSDPATGLSGALIKSVGNINAGQPVSINATPFTTIIAELVERSRGSGNATPLLVQQAQVAITTTLGFNPVATQPVNPRDPASSDASPEAKKQAILLAALAQLSQGIADADCPEGTTPAAKQICAANSLAMAYAGSSIANNQATVSIDGSQIQGFTAAISAVSSNMSINQTGASVDPATDPATDEIRMAEMNPNEPQTTEVATPEQGFNETDVAAVKTLFNNLRSNAAALDNDELNGPLETQLADFADSLTSQATGLEPGPFDITEATALGIELWATHQFFAAQDPQSSRPVFFSAGSAVCFVLSSVTRQPDQPVTGVVFANPSGANNARFVGCTVFGDGASRPQGNGFLELRNYVLMTPISGQVNTFNVESDSRFCDIDFSQDNSVDRCLSLEGNSRVIGGVAGANVATASGNKTFDSMGVTTSMTGSFSGMVAPPIEFDFSDSANPTAVELADTTNVDIDFTATFPDENSVTLVGSGSFTTTSGDQTITTALSSFNVSGTEDPETQESTGSIEAEGRIETQLGALRGSFSADSDAGVIEFTGAVDLKEGSATNTLFEGAVTLSGTPATETMPATASVLFDGTLSLPNRPELVVELQVNNAVLNDTMDGVDTVSLAFTYQQNGTTVILNASRNEQGVESITISSPTSMVTVGPFNPDSAQTVDVLRDGRLAARYSVADARVNYVDGTFEQF